MSSFSHSLKQKSIAVWEDSYRHPFVQELGAGTLPQETFQFYLVQDYLYLYEYARVFALGAVKAKNEELMANFTLAQHSTLNVEMNLHRAYMQSFGISLEEAGAAKSSLFNKAYTSNMLAVAQTGDVLDILMTLFPCAWTYYDFGMRLKEDYAHKLESNLYRSWIEMYGSQAFLDSWSWFYDAIDQLAAGKSPEELRRLEEIFHDSVAFEYLFWDMAYKRQMTHRL